MHTNCTLCANTMHTYADFISTKTKPSACAPALSKVVEALDHGAVAVHLDRPSIAVLPLVFLLLDPSKRREATNTDPSLLCHVGPEIDSNQCTRCTMYYSMHHVCT